MSAVDLSSLLLIAAGALEQRVLDRLEEAGHPSVRSSHGFVFQVLLRSEPTVTELARELGITQQGASKAVAELERLGYVERRRDAGDARVRRLALTERAHDVIEVARRTRQEFERELEGEVGADALGAARGVLTVATRVLDVAEPIDRHAVPMPASANLDGR